MGVCLDAPGTQSPSSVGDGSDIAPAGCDLDGRGGRKNFSAIAPIDPDLMETPEPEKQKYYIITVGWRISIFDDW